MESQLAAEENGLGENRKNICEDDSNEEITVVSSSRNKGHRNEGGKHKKQGRTLDKDVSESNRSRSDLKDINASDDKQDKEGAVPK